MRLGGGGGGAWLWLVHFLFPQVFCCSCHPLDVLDTRTSATVRSSHEVLFEDKVFSVRIYREGVRASAWVGRVLFHFVESHDRNFYFWRNLLTEIHISAPEHVSQVAPDCGECVTCN